MVQKGCRKGAENEARNKTRNEAGSEAESEAEEAITTRQIQVLELIKKNNKGNLVEKMKISATIKQGTDFMFTFAGEIKT